MIRSPLKQLFWAVAGIEDMMTDGVKLINNAFEQWKNKTENPIFGMIVLILHLAFLAVSFLVGFTVLAALAGIPIILLMELIRWLTGKGPSP